MPTFFELEGLDEKLTCCALKIEEELNKITINNANHKQNLIEALEKIILA